MQGDNAPRVNGGSLNLPKSSNGSCETSSRNGNTPEYMPKLNITLGGSTYTKTIDLQPQDIYNLSNLTKLEVDTNGAALSRANEPVIIKNGIQSQNIDPMNSPNNGSFSSSVLINNQSAKLSPGSRSTFFSRLARRLTIRRTTSKRVPTMPAANTTPSKPVNKKSLARVPTNRKIRRWLSKHLIPSSKQSSSKTTSDATEEFSARAATFDLAADTRASPQLEDFGSAPTHRRGLPITNLSESSLCNSQTGTLSLTEETHDSIGNTATRVPTSRTTEPITISVSKAPSKQDNLLNQISSALSSPSVTATGPPPRYLNVSLSAFGYNRKWMSSHTLERAKGGVLSSTAPQAPPAGPVSTATTAAVSSNAAGSPTGDGNFPTFLNGSVDGAVTPQKPSKSGSPEPALTPATVAAQRPQRLGFYDEAAAATASTPQASPGKVSLLASDGQASNNTSVVTIRVKRASTSAKAAAAAATAGEDLNRSNHSAASASQHWNRSSLIMLAVAQASPRSHNAASTSEAGSIASPTGSSVNVPQPASPSKPFPGRRLPFGDEASSPIETCPEPTSSTATTGLEESVASLKMTNGDAEFSVENGGTTVPSPSTAVVKDGYYFQKVVNDTAQELRARVEEIEQDLKENELPEEVSGHLRATVGKVNLLLSQKFDQFRELCDASVKSTAAVACDSVDGGGGELVTLPSDLEGFWAMVMLQVDDVRAMIAQCERLRESGWRAHPDSPLPNGSRSSGVATPAIVKRRPTKPTAGKAARAGAGGTSPAAKSKANKEAQEAARFLARERVKAARLQFMRAQRQQQQQAEQVSGQQCNGDVNGNSVTETAVAAPATYMVL